MQLWTGVLSPFSAKVRIALAEKGLAYEALEIPWSRQKLWGPKPEAFLAVSPQAQVPVLVDGDRAVPDSTVILEYLEDAYPEPSLYPHDPATRAQVRLLEDDADAALAQDVTTLVREVFRKPDASERDQAAITAAAAALNERYARWERALSADGELPGAFGVADITVFMALGFASTLGVPPGDAHPKLSAWFARTGQRESIRTEFEAMTKAAAAA